MEKTEYYLVTVDIDSFGVYSLDQIQFAVQKALDQHIDLPNVFKVNVASVTHVDDTKDNDGHYKVEGKQYFTDGEKK